MASFFISRCLLLLLLVLSRLLVVPAIAVQVKEAVGSFNSIYSFGDIGDSSTSSAADHIAAALSLPFPQPFSQQDTEFFESGLSFATPGATIMNPFFFLKNGITPPLQSHDPTQIVTFMQFFYKDCFLFHDWQKQEAGHLVPEVVATIKNSVERLINEAGAKTVMVSGVLPMGCFPGFQSLFPEGDSIGKGRCHKGLNMFARLHNDHLWQAILELRLEHPAVHIIYADYYKAFMAVVKNHAFLGFKTKTLMKACCGSGNGPFNFDVQKKCGEEGVTTCSDRAMYIHWDGFRLTPKALENLIDTLFSKKGFIFPEIKFGEETTAAVERHHSRIHGGVRDTSSIVRHLLCLSQFSIFNYV
ncbi:putative salicylic acid-binding protein 2-like [Capsicum annuum]|nr:putative salicylic acid-binding protein 2-like [Capsicum annuum]